MRDDEDVVTSEVNNQLVCSSDQQQSCDGFVVTTFRFEYPQWLSSMPGRDQSLDTGQIEDTRLYDEDGDLIVVRRRPTMQAVQEGQITLEHLCSTNLKGTNPLHDLMMNISGFFFGRFPRGRRGPKPPVP